MKKTIPLFLLLAFATMLGIFACAHYPLDDEGPPDGPCVGASCPDAPPPLPECRLNSDCPGCGDTCEDGTCKKTLCCTDDECPSGKKCDDGVCTTPPECTCDDDCKTCGTTCDEGKCVASDRCDDDRDCCGSKECRNGECKPPPAPCSCDDDCAHGWTCSHTGYCKPKT